MLNELRCLMVKKTDMSTYIVVHNVILAVFFFQIAMFPIVMYDIGFVSRYTRRRAPTWNDLEAAGIAYNTGLNAVNGRSYFVGQSGADLSINYRNIGLYTCNYLAVGFADRENYYV